MSGLEVNKILASIFVAVIVVSLISILGDAIINKKNNQQVEVTLRNLNHYLQQGCHHLLQYYNFQTP